jgi:hypothetical protein
VLESLFFQHDVSMQQEKALAKLKEGIWTLQKQVMGVQAGIIKKNA